MAVSLKTKKELGVGGIQYWFNLQLWKVGVIPVDIPRSWGEGPRSDWRLAASWPGLGWQMNSTLGAARLEKGLLRKVVGRTEKG